ncbi:cell adhesion molecule DSCAM-like isoform X2 [Littorina saxatilis]|uniref:protein-tyrosine-phosphatase n=1 Tax=Littorina saxatilis TaxID=31220 RepID=A0AAN9B735_9CAEN
MWTAVLICLCHCLLLVTSQDAPEFLEEQQQVVAVKGTQTIIPCRIKNLGSHRVLWSFEKILLTFDDRRITDDMRISLERPYKTEWNLHIGDVRPTDAGMYSCQINTNPMTSQIIKLVVLDEQPSPVVPDEVAAMAGTKAEIMCKLPDTNDIGTWSYKADEKSEGRTIIENDKYDLLAGEGQDSHVHTLVINDVRAGDEGFYFCRARSGAQSGTSLKVVVPPPPPSLEAKAESPNKLTMRWKRPVLGQADVTGYTLYINNIETGKEHIFEVDSNEDPTGLESFSMGDLTTNTTYMVQLATKLQMGDEVVTGKKSPEVNITTPYFMPDAPGWVKVKRQSDDAAEVTWRPPDAKTSGIIRGYRVTYYPLAGNRKPILAKQKTVEVEGQEGNRWEARLTGLRPKTRYQVQVAGYTRKGVGRSSKPVGYLHKTLPPELSLNGRVLSKNSVLLTVTSLGNGKMGNIKMFYTEASQPSWKRLDFSSEWKFTVVGGLDPRTSYFFKVKGKIGGKMKHSVTHITTPPHDLLVPQAVSVSATASTSIEVLWDYVIANGSSSLPLGYIVHLEETSEKDEDERRHRQSVVFNRTSVEVKDLTPDVKYTIQVVAFNGFGEGPRTDGLLFHIAESGVKQDAVNEPYPPRFTHVLPEELSIQSGETVKITCEADGYPVPEVRWFDNGEPIGEPAQGSNQLFMANVRQSTVLTCRATSQWGDIETSTKVLMVKDEEEDTGQEDNLAIGVITTNIMSTTLTVAWEIIAGDPESIDHFEIDITDDTDRILLTRTLPGQTNSFNLRSLQPGAEYRAKLRAYGASPTGKQDELLLEATASAVTLSSDDEERTTTTRAPIVTPPPQQNKYRAWLPLSIVDVTPNSALLSWDFTGLDPRYVHLFELKVKSRSNFTLLTETLKPNLKVMDLTLQPGQFYFVQVRAFDRSGRVLALNTTQVATPSKEMQEETVETTDEEEAPVLKRASLTLTPHAVTGEAARLDWSLAGAQQEDIDQFVLKVKDEQDRTLLRQDMRRESRSLTLSNLSPRTKYFAELLAVDDKGATVAMTTMSFTTTSLTTDETDDDSTNLRVFTEELDSNLVKVAWYVPPKILPDLSGVTVQLTDIANVALLTQQMSALTRSLTVRNLQPGERYKAHVELKGQRGEVVRSGFLEFDTEPTPGMPGRPDIRDVEVANNSAVRVEWRNTPSPSPAAGSNEITGYVINFALVDNSNQPTSGTYQLPIFGSAQYVVIPNLRAGQRYMFQVAARNQYSFGPMSAPVFASLPRN